MNRTDLGALGVAVALALFLSVFATNGFLSEYNVSGIASTTSPSGMPSGARAIIAGLASKSKNATSTKTAVATKAPASSSENLTLALAKLGKSLVNIVCTINTPSGQFLTSGSGVVIDSRGVILTNAHVAQFLLLKEGPTTTSCSIRTGSPAKAAYKGELVYISKAWIKAHPGTALSGKPSGTGEYDFALVAITGSLSGNPLPSSYPSVPLKSSPLAIKQEEVLASYGAQGLSAEQVRNALYPTLAFGSIKSVYAFRQTFDLNAIDLIALGANSAAQAGSSGGGVANAKGELIALITTSKPGSNVSAITARHIERSFREDTGIDLKQYLLSKTVAQLVADFSTGAEELAMVLK
ncbi:MAG: hypothetical protein AB199_00555 [Parcubacteria bacterium C7867-004]|nr:MAG: hypothetical protein AB199_00555 [Parcubacteria bacterium C7867-004]